MSENSDALRIARMVVAEACELLVGAQADIGAIRRKSGLRDWVTQWDHRCEELLVRRLGELSPGVSILAEESGARGEPGALQWLIDPIDGTVNFAHGLPMFGVTVALEKDGQAVAGVIAAPAMGFSGFAAKGAGAFVEQGGQTDSLAVSSTDALGDAILASGFPYDRATNRHNFAEWEHFQCTAGACRRIGAASLDLLMVARGWLDGYWESRLNPWDLSAGALLVQEAGGRVSALDGSSFSSASGAALATNGHIHAAMLGELVQFQP